MAILGYARVSTGEQNLEPQLIELREAGCSRIHEEHASGANRARPVLARLIETIAPGDTLVVVRLDRLARSLVHLLQVIERLEARGAHFRSLHDPIDTSTPQGKFSLQVMGAVAELERALIAERTKAGLRAAKAEGRVGGNPGLKAREPSAIRKARLGRDEVYMQELLATAEEWVGPVRRHRPRLGWKAMAAHINAKLPPGRPEWSEIRLRRACARFVREGMMEASVLERAPRKDVDDRLMAVVAGIAGADPALTVRDIGRRLEKMREKTPRGGVRWNPSSVQMLLERARSHGLLDPEHPAT
ncbi:recombinase family protein [Cereibacter sphaeroides]|uniref:recombinase family protein n=1 Tax=Cereibacter sphaeroides TaxID=1063 RepID=UPI001F392B8C|nr:recombinase family protein [Cereibacter sphaeroides]MCE6958380.1 recombinase family protein [Cereibacter sphaeroides]MCE6972247.1 recombinase family protein [Cereibacter sphaeroides]